MATDLQVGEELGGFRIESVIGRGGMGVVYLARDLTLERMAALKVVTPELADDPEFRERFLREARLAASLDHPNIVPIHHAGEVNGRLYIAMRYVSSDLRTVIDADAPLEPGRAISLLDQAATGLDAAHRRGLVHRDVKPANILIEPGSDESDVERAFLTDFGLVKHLDSATRLTRSGMFLGTLEYAAPEQLQGKTLDGRTDLYALGCILFECLTGSPPYEAQTEAQMMYAHVFEPPPRPSERSPELPRALDDVIARAMAKEIADRYATCAALIAAARDELIGGRPASAPPMPRDGGVAGAIPPMPAPIPAPPAPTPTPAPTPAPPPASETVGGPAARRREPELAAPAPPEREREATVGPSQRRAVSVMPAVAIVGASALLLLAGLAAPIRKGVGVKLDVNKPFFQERLWHLFEPAVVPLLAATAVLLVLWGIGPRRFLSGALIGFGIASTLRNLELLASAATNTSPDVGIFLRLAGSLALVAGGGVAYRRVLRADGGAVPETTATGPAGTVPLLWGLGAALVVAGVLLPFATAEGGGGSASIIASHDPERTWYVLEPLVLAAGALAAALWWWRGAPDRRLPAGLAAAGGTQLALQFLLYAVAPILISGVSPAAGGFLGLAGGVVIAVGGLMAYRRARAGSLRTAV